MFPEIPWRLSTELPRAVVMVYPLVRGVLDTLRGAPNHLYFHHYRQVNNLLDREALAMAAQLEAQGYRALPIAASQTLDADDLTAHISHRHMAFVAGLGHRGKNNLLVTPQFGAAVRLVTVLTDAPLDVGTPAPSDSGCGACTACRKACPASAIGNTPDDFNLDACIRQVSQFRKLPRIGQRICGLCQQACRGRATAGQ